MSGSINDLREYLQSNFGGYTQANANSLNDLESLINDMGSFRSSGLPADDGTDLSGVDCTVHTAAVFPYPNTEQSFGDFKDYADTNVAPITCSSHTYNVSWCGSRSVCSCNNRTNCSCNNRYLSSSCGCRNRSASGCGCNARTDICECHAAYVNCGCYTRSAASYSCSSVYTYQQQICSGVCNGHACSCERRGPSCCCYSNFGLKYRDTIYTCDCDSRTACSCNARCRCNTVETF